jgi:hypothetical protein
MIYGIKILRYCQVGKLYKAKKNKYNWKVYAKSVSIQHKLYA